MPKGRESTADLITRFRSRNNPNAADGSHDYFVA